MTLTQEELTAKVLGHKGKHWVSKILLLLLANQTADEQESNTTSHQNGNGFAGADAEFGTKVAKYIQDRGHITNGQYDAWIKLNSKGVPKICKYWRQVNAAIEAKAAHQQEEMKMAA